MKILDHLPDPTEESPPGSISGDDHQNWEASIPTNMLPFPSIQPKPSLR